MKLLYTPLSLLIGVLGGILAGAAFKRVWRLVADEDDAPDAADFDRTWREVLVAAAVQGAVFGLIKAATRRAGARGVQKLTGHRPGD